MKVKGYTIKDNNTKVITFPNRVTVKVRSTGMVFEASGEVSVDSFSDLVRLNETTKVKHIEHIETGETISELVYLEMEKELLSKRIWDEFDESHRWSSLDDEFNYRKFKASYQKIYETVYEEEELLVEEAASVIMDTGHPYIKSKFYTTGEVSDVCVYNKPAAYMGILCEKMQEIGAEYVDGSGFSDRTEGKLAWSVSTHSGIRYAKLAGDYLFGDSYDVKGSRTGTFESLKVEYESDRDRIREIIHNKYLLKFGKVSEERTLVVLDAIRILNSSLSALDLVVPSKKTYDSKLRTSGHIRKAIGMLNNTFEVK